MKDRKPPGTRRPQQTPNLENQNLSSLPWNLLEQQVAQMQKHIAQTTRRGDKQAIHHLQQALMESQAARLLAGPRRTDEKPGKETARTHGRKPLTAIEQLSIAV